MDCNLNFIVNRPTKGVLKDTGSHVHFKSGSVLKTVLDEDVETTVHKHEVTCRRPYGHLIAATVMILCVCQSHSSIENFFYIDKHVAWSLCHGRASCRVRPYSN